MSSPNPQNNHDNRNPKDWTPCPKGTISELSRELNDKTQLAQTQQRRKFVVAACAGAGLIAMCGTSIYLLQRSDEEHQPNSYGGITCAEVKQNMVAFRDGSLDEQLSGRIRLHLEECSYCAAKMKELA